jgi:tRNA-dihydrouridine synthase C
MHLPVSAKMRLGLHDDHRAEECALAIEAGGATELVVHARTGQQAYRPPAYWGRVADIQQVVKIPLVANGEIWSVADAQACAMQSGCQILMLGRGMVARPSLAREILAGDALAGSSEMDWAQVLPLIADFWQLVKLHLERRQQTGRLKQWLYLLQRTYPEAQRAFLLVRPLHDPALVDIWLRDSRAISAKSSSASISPSQA